MSQESRHDPQEILSKLRATYLTPEHREQSLAHFETLDQAKDQTTEDYLHKLHEIRNQAKPLELAEDRNRAVFKRMIEGMNDSAFAEALQNKYDGFGVSTADYSPTKVAQQITKLRGSRKRLEKHTKNKDAAQPSTSSSSHNRGNDKRDKDSKSTKDLPVDEFGVAKRQREFNGLCNFCQKPGHKMADCQNFRIKSLKKLSFTNTSDDPYERRKAWKKWANKPICFICSSEDHYSAHCPERRSSSRTSSARRTPNKSREPTPPRPQTSGQTLDSTGLDILNEFFSQAVAKGIQRASKPTTPKKQQGN